MYVVEVRSKFIQIPPRRQQELREAVATVEGVTFRSLERADDGSISVTLRVEAAKRSSAKTKAQRAVERWAKGPGAGWHVEDPATYDL